ncbi:MAG: NAD(+)/NADH kinase [Candidatus Omnitrophica bacterium]|nr:NAD(+)/NADH kinase [Candidatus Omnitrophota bacterium]
MSTDPSRVLVVYKKSAYQLHVVERRDRRLRCLLRAHHQEARDLLAAHQVHQRTLEAVIRAVRDLGMRFDVVYREELRSATRYDLVVSVGGDGTLLQASHLVDGTPVVGVNSDPSRSEAVFCAATRRTVSSILRHAIEGRLDGLALTRLQVKLNGRLLKPFVLNDVLIAHDNPATMSRYHLKIGVRREDQKSSGLWVATAAGSSSAILAAGGRRLAWDAKRFQYRPRELYEGRLHRYHLTGGILPLSAAVEVTWLMREGAAFIDGPHVRHPLRFGDRLKVEVARHHPLIVLGARGPHR